MGYDTFSVLFVWQVTKVADGYPGVHVLQDGPEGLLHTVSPGNSAEVTIS